MSMKKKLFSWVLAAVMVLSLVPLTAMAANTPVSYLSPVMNSGVLAGFEEKSCSNYTEVNAVAPSRTWYENYVERRTYKWGISGQDTWYVVSGDMNTLGEVIVNGNVHLILKDGCTLTTTGADGYAGIRVRSGNSLTIYGQKSGTGELIVTGGCDCAGIGSDRGNSYGDIVINGGTVTATGSNGGAGIGSGEFLSKSDAKKNQNNGTIVINGGTVTAGGNGGGAGIGGGNCMQGCNIEINGGNVKATSAGLFSGAGIGGGLGGDGCNLVISGGNVTAFSEGGGAGIGGGTCGNGTDITINGGTVTAQGSSAGAGIGGGYEGTAKNIFIWGGIISAIAARPASAIGSGEDSETPASNIEIDTSMTIRNEKTSAIVPNETKDLSTVLKGISKLSVTQGQMESVNYQFPIITETRLTGFENKLCESYCAFRKDGSVSSKRDQSSNSALWGIDGQDTWYVASGDITIPGGVTVYGNVHLILTDGCTLTVTGGGGSAGINVPIGRTLTVYGQSGGTGALIATGGANGAGIGGSDGNGHGKVTINGGHVTATGGYGAAGIGGSYSDGGNLDVNGGTVIATGCGGGAGIGGGCFGTGSNIMIQGGNITANGGHAGKTAIGNGQSADDDASNIKVSTALQILSILPNKNPYVKDEVKTTVIANDGEDLASVLAGVMNLSITPLQESIPVTRAVGEDASALADPITDPEPAAKVAVKLRFHGVEGAVNEVELTPGAVLDDTLLTLTDPAFVGWYYDVNYETRAQVGDVIDKDTELYLRETEDQTEYPYEAAPTQTGSVFSDSSTGIVIAVAVILLGAGTAAVIVKKKKSQ